MENTEEDFGDFVWATNGTDNQNYMTAMDLHIFISFSLYIGLLKHQVNWKDA